MDLRRVEIACAIACALVACTPTGDIGGGETETETEASTGGSATDSNSTTTPTTSPAATSTGNGTSSASDSDSNATTGEETTSVDTEPGESGSSGGGLMLPGDCVPIPDSCDEMTSCIERAGSWECLPDTSVPGTMPGDPCEFANTCGDGMVCTAAAVLDTCDATSCCAAFCLISAGTCADCQPYYADPPPGAEDLGLCVQ